MEELIPIKKGDLFSLKKITNSIKQVYKTGLFSDIQVLKEGEQEVKLIFLLTRKLFSRRIIITGEQKISRKKLREGLYSLFEGSFFTDEKLNKAVEELKEALIKEGYFFPKIEAYSKKDPGSSSVDVFFNIHPTKKFFIKEIAFSGERILQDDELKKEMKSKEGKVYVPSVLDEDILKLKNIYSSMGYQRAEIDVEKINFDEKEEKVSLFIKIFPHEKIEIEVKGAEVPLSLLKPIWEERIFEEWGLAEGKAKILGYMRKKGYIYSSVLSFIEKDNNKMRVVYNVTPGKKYTIQDISFNGLNYFTPSELKKELETTGRASVSSLMNGERLFELPEDIEYIYKTRGFPDAQVNFQFMTPGNRVKALFFIEEGNQDSIERISFEGAYLFRFQTLLEQISSFEGGPFFQLNIQKDIDKLENFYLNQGVRGTEITARVEKISDHVFSVVFVLREGNKVKIGNIVITGNVASKRKTILREIRIKEGDYAFYDRISESKRRLERLGIFTKVEIEEIPISSERENLVVSVREGERNYASLGVGLETESEPQTFAIWNNLLRLRGTGEYIRSNIFGSGAQLSLVGQFSLKEKRGVFSWEQPYFFGIPLQTYLNVWLEQDERKSFTYDRQGVSLTAIKPIAENILFLTTLRYARTTLIDLLIEESEVDRRHQPFSATSVSGSFLWDRRDDPFNPKKGTFFSFVLEWAYPLFKAESDYLKTFLKYQHFIPIFPGVTVSATSRLGLGGGSKPIPIHERFFGGGSNSFRGEKFDEMGPKDQISLKPIGGEALMLLNIEMTFPLLSAIKNLSGALFYDTGNVFGEVKQFSLDSLQDAVGFGIRYKTPLGPVRLELGWNLSKPREERKAIFIITIGNVF
ncbi:MAG: outer membrane protein assembly factor BamA [Candidatus Aminicenantes bacterium]|nr:outer membrane protein assembly factor BamA [Candidatus Aminicenantes bacterium]